MKKKIFSLVVLLCITTLSLTSCNVNWSGEQYDVPWWTIAIPVVVFSVIVWFAAGKYIASKEYVCPKCNKTFYPKWWKAAFSVHINHDRVFRCPHCGRKGFCHVEDKDNRE